MAFGHYLRREREGRDITLTELARRVEVSIAYLSRIEREARKSPAGPFDFCLGRRAPHARG
jgi:transcriptional regulator with XRE-family HTH domain